MASKSTLKTAEQLLDRFFRDAEGRTNRQIDVYFAVQDMGLTDKAEEALQYLQSRGLLNLFGSDIAFLTDKGVGAVVDEVDIGALPKEARDFAQKATGGGAAPTPRAAPSSGKTGGGTSRPERPQLTHIDLDGGEFTLELSWSCKVGRADDNEVRIDDKRASKHHAEIYYEAGKYYLRDLESANGTLLNGDYALEPLPLKHDDEVVIGRTMLLFQTPELIPEPAPIDAVEEALEDPDPSGRARRPMGPTERPGPAAASEDVGHLRVVKGVAVTPPSGQTPPPRVSDADLFAEPPTRGGASDDLFGGPAPEADPEDLFGDEPPTHRPGRDLFARDDALEETPAVAPPRASDDLFADQRPSTGGDDLFTTPQAPAARRSPPPHDASGGLELEPIAPAPERTPPSATPHAPLDRGDTVAEPPVDDLWTDDTPASPGPDPAGPMVDAEVGDDGDTMMMSRDTFAEAQSQAAAVGSAPSSDEHPSWAAAEDASHPGFGDVTGPLSGTVDAEALPEATPSLAMPAVAAAPPDVQRFYAQLDAIEAHLEARGGAGAAAALEAVRRVRREPSVREALLRRES